jgi:cobalt/nickel transport protein
VNSTVDQPWLRRALAIVVVLALLAPVFAWAAGEVGYTEPFEHAAEDTGAADAAEPSPSLFSGYAVFGLGHLGTLLSALVGAALALAGAYGLARLAD